MSKKQVTELSNKLEEVIDEFRGKGGMTYAEVLGTLFVLMKTLTDEAGE